MRNILLTIEYDGTHFHGWQIQNPSQRTIQGEFQKSFKKIFGKKIVLIGAGRTDRGVHALGQTANFKTNSPMSTATILKALNANLPADIAVTNIREVPGPFHAQYNAKSKIYRYTLLNRAMRCPLRQYDTFHCPYPLHVNLMRKEAKHLVGKKDFKSFRASDPARLKKGEREDTVRTVKQLSITKKNDLIVIEIEADGFLYKMVRNIVGTLLEIGSHRLPQGGILKILKKKNRGAASKTAKACGLCLLKVIY